MISLIADRYRLDERLAFINHSEFYNGFDLQTQQPVIVRLIDLHQDNQKYLEKLERFMENELRLVKRLIHPYMLKILDYGRQENIYYQINEFMEFRTLRDEIKQNPCDLLTALRYGRDLAAIVAQLHAAYIIHCDLKPENVLVTNNGLKLIEFSVANHTVPDGIITGTPAYLSPEAIRAEYPISTARDVWAMGIILYELITGDVPYTMSIKEDGSENKIELLMKIILEPVPPLADRMPNLPPRLLSLIDRMLEKETVKRIADMSYVTQELDVLLSEFSMS
jgi:eukaryotic-like serine/threonine-protein kinase